MRGEPGDVRQPVSARAVRAAAAGIRGIADGAEFAPADDQLLKDTEPDEVIAALDHQLAALGATAGESLLLFYYSGHADAGALFPAGKPLPFGFLALVRKHASDA